MHLLVKPQKHLYIEITQTVKFNQQKVSCKKGSNCVRTAK